MPHVYSNGTWRQNWSCLVGFLKNSVEGMVFFFRLFSSFFLTLRIQTPGPDKLTREITQEDFFENANDQKVLGKISLFLQFRR